MINLLHAGFSKLLRTAAFRSCAIFIAIMAVANVLLNLMNSTPTGPLNGVYNSVLEYMPFVIAGFVTLFIGQEYSDKTINNKIMAGHSRTSIFLADYIVSLSGAVMLQILSAVLSTLTAVPLFGMYTESLGDILCSQLLVFCVIAVYTAVALVLTMVISSKSNAVAAAIFIMFALFIAGTIAFDKVTRMQIAAAENGETLSAETMTDREKAYCLMYDIVPQSQAFAIMTYTVPDNTAKIVWYDFAAAALITGAGIMVFRKKDIK